MSERHPVLYILANKRNGTLYTGVTSRLEARIAEHKSGEFSGFTRKYNVRMLVYFESHQTMTDAIIREKQIKKWNRAWKIALIEESNPTWHDLSAEWEY